MQMHSKIVLHCSLNVIQYYTTILYVQYNTFLPSEWNECSNNLYGTHNVKTLVASKNLDIHIGCMHIWSNLVEYRGIHYNCKYATKNKSPHINILHCTLGWTFSLNFVTMTWFRSIWVNARGSSVETRPDSVQENSTAALASIMQLTVEFEMLKVCSFSNALLAQYKKN